MFFCKKSNSAHLSLKERACFVFLWCCTVFHCGGGTSSNAEDSTISIINQTFVPSSITAQPGDTLFFVNYDTVNHQILNQSSPNSFNDTGAFDSDTILPGTTGEIVLPEDVTAGDTVYFYCGLFEDTMLTPNGEIFIE